MKKVLREKMLMLNKLKFVVLVQNIDNVMAELSPRTRPIPCKAEIS